MLCKICVKRAISGCLPGTPSFFCDQKKEAKKSPAVDGWTVKTKDGGLAAHFEHSNAILKDRTEIMTRFWDDPDFDPETFSLK